MEKMDIIWDGDVASNHSYAIVNREIVQALLCQGARVSILGRDGRGQLIVPRVAYSRGGRELFTLGGFLPRAYVRHIWPPDFSRPDLPAAYSDTKSLAAYGSMRALTTYDDVKFVVIQPWEYGYLPVNWVDPIKENVDEIWAYSEFVKETYVRSGVDTNKVHVIGCGVNPVNFHPGIQPMVLPTAKHFRFLFVGGAATSRKGLDVLLSAFTAEFRRDEDVALVIKDWFYGNIERQIEEFRRRPDCPEIVYIYRNFSLSEMAALYSSCQAYVHPFRAEGFGLTVLEAMACGLPVIVTDYGPVREFCNPANSYLIRSRIIHFPEARVGEWVTCGIPFWAEPDFEHLRELLRRVFTDQEEGKEKGARAARDALSGWTWEKVASRVMSRLKANLLHLI